MRTETINVTTDSSGAGTAVSRHPIAGEVRRIVVGANFGTAHVTLSEASDAYASGTASPSVLFHGAGTVIFGQGAVIPYAKYKSFPVIGGSHVRVCISGPGYAQAASKTDSVKIIYADDV